MNFNNNNIDINTVKQYLSNQLIKFCKDLKSVHLKQKYVEAKKMYKNISSSVQDQIVNNPSTFFANCSDNLLFNTNNNKIRGGGQDKQSKESFLEGQAIFDTKFVSKMDKIANLFNLYKNINFTEIQKKTIDLSSELDKILA